jgi:hypothetical protein
VPGNCAFLTLQNPAGFFIDDELSYAPLRVLGWQVEAVPWRTADVDWRRYDLVVIRSPWDYQRDPAAFLGVLEAIEAAGVALQNRLAQVRWNLEKTYLLELAERGVGIVPTVWRDRLAAGELAALFGEVGNSRIVIKPVVGANADGAFRLDCATVAGAAAGVEDYYADRPLMAQPWVDAITGEGEYSLIYFNGVYSHAVQKTPKAGDFRVQEEHGAAIRSVTPGPGLRAAGDAVLAALDEVPLYARADFVRANGRESFWLMELELIEPGLYLRMDAGAPGRFARALDVRLTGATR